MNKQQIFNKVSKHLLKQKVKSIIQETPQDHEMCAYRSNDGLKCAIGCLITDDEYDDRMEGTDIASIEDSDFFPARIHDLVKKNNDLLMKLQYVHDYYEPKDWREELKKVAIHYNLNHDHLKVKKNAINAAKELIKPVK